MKAPLAAIAVLAAIFCASVQAADFQGRVDFDGTKDGVALTVSKPEGGNASNASWFKDDPAKNQQYVLSYFPAGPEWKKASVTVTPEKDGNVVLSLKGAWDKDPAQMTWTIFDAVQAEGAELKNGNFEEGQAGWGFGGKEGEKASLVDNAKSGSKGLKTSHNSPAYQLLAVKAKQPVTVSFWFKRAE